MKGMTGSRVPIALTVAARQHGVISLRQLAELEVSRSQLRTAIKRHLFVEAAPRVYAVVGAPDTLEQRQQVALLSLGPDAVLSHETAARLHGFDRCRPDVIELTVPRRHLLRTVRSDRSGPCRLLRTVRYPLRGPGRWGAPRLDRLLIDAGGHTLLERRFLKLMRTAGLPRPTTQLVHRVNGRTYARVDFCFEGQSIVVEVSGRKGHSSPSERARDAQRRNELQDAGRRVYEFTYEQVFNDGAHVQCAMRERLTRAGWRR